MPIKVSAWTPSEDHILIKYWHIQSTRKIAEFMQKTYKSVAGRAYRLQLGPKESSRGSLKKRLAAAKAPVIRIIKDPPNYDLMPIFNDPDRPGKPMRDHRGGECRWPVRKGHYCCTRSLKGFSYCEYHQTVSRSR